MRSTLPVASAPPDRLAALRLEPERRAIHPALGVAILFLATRAVALAGMLWAKHGDVSATVVAATRLYDSGWYDRIVLHGYGAPGEPINAFYPGYPLAVGAVYWPLHLVASLFVQGSTLQTWSEGTLLPASTLLLCNLALVAALAVLWRLYAPRLGPTATLLGIGFLLAVPTSFFLSNGYGESLFILLAASAFLLAERRHWFRVGLLAAGAALVRFPGAFLVVPLAMLWLRQPPPRPVKAAIGGAAAFLLAAAAFPSWLWATSGDPLAYLRLQAAHQRHLVGPWVAVADVLDQAHQAERTLRGRLTTVRMLDVPTAFANFLALIAGGTTMVAGWVKLKAPEVVWVGIVFLVPLLTGTGQSLDRYWLAAFPFFFLLGAWLRRWPVVALGLMVLSSVYLFVLADHFARVVWVG